MAFLNFPHDIDDISEFVVQWNNTFSSPKRQKQTPGTGGYFQIFTPGFLVDIAEYRGI